MMTAPDFRAKQVLFVFCNAGEKLSFGNDNIVVKNADGSVKFQCTCYRLFLVFVVGHCSLTTPLIQKAKKFGFFFALMTSGFRLYALIGADKEGNTLLRRKQYQYDALDIARKITGNKIANQMRVLQDVRDKSPAVEETILALKAYAAQAGTAEDLHSLLAYEGLSSKAYFKAHFNNVPWQGRAPRLKRDYINSVMDIGYTVLFAFIDALLESYGFDVYCGVMHTQFYMRKSLVCDLVEPFRPLIDKQIKKSVNLKQIKPEDFLEINKQFQLKWEKSAEYVQFLMQPILDYKEDIFLYVQSYYRAFMKGADIGQYPVFSWGGRV